MRFRELRRAIGEADINTVSGLSGWIIGVVSALTKAAGRAEFDNLSYKKQLAVIKRFALLQNRVTDANAKRAAQLMHLYLSAAAEGNDELADDIWTFMDSHAEPMIRHFRRRQARH
jgi:hypothetical protein